MIIDHTNYLYRKKWNSLNKNDKYNGAYYYSKEIVKNIIPNVKTDRNWITIRLQEMKEHPDHSIIFIHNNKNPDIYSYIKDYKDCILVCGLPQTAKNLQCFGKTIYLPLSVDVNYVKKFCVKRKTKGIAYAGRLCKLFYYNNIVPSGIDILTGMPQSQLLKEMAKYKIIYASGRTAIQAKILGCSVLPHETNFESEFWKVIDNLDASKLLQQMLNEIDGVKKMKVITRYRLGDLIGTVYQTSLGGQPEYIYKIRHKRQVKGVSYVYLHNQEDCLNQMISHMEQIYDSDKLYK